MTDPFLKASQRIIRRLGKPITILVEGVPMEPAPLGIFDKPEGDTLHRGTKGQLVFKQRRESLTVLTEDVPNLDKTWQIFIDNTEYFAADHEDDSHGCTVIYLAKQTQKDEGNGSVWC